VVVTEQRHVAQFATLPADNPFNRGEFKYVTATPCTLLRFLQYCEKDVGHFEPGVFLSPEDRSMFTLLSRDGLSVTTEKGFRMAKATQGVKQGKWFFEVFIDNAVGGDDLDPVTKKTLDTDGPQSHVRLGWARREGEP
jgi:COMPASS component BRE2